MQLEGYVSNTDNDYGIPYEPGLEDITWQFVAPLASITRKPLLNLVSRGINGLSSWNVDRQVGLRDVNDGVKRTFYTREQAEDYYNNLLSDYDSEQYKNNDLIDFENISQQGKKALRKQWKQFAKDNLLHKDINIPNYPTSRFSSKNIGKEYLHNLPLYEDVEGNLPNSNYRFTTNFNEEADRLYDHLIDNNSKGLFDYLMEVVKDDKGNISHTYKMMKNITRGDKP